MLTTDNQCLRLHYELTLNLICFVTIQGQGRCRRLDQCRFKSVLYLNALVVHGTRYLVYVLTVSRFVKFLRSGSSVVCLMKTQWLDMVWLTQIVWLLTLFGLNKESLLVHSPLYLFYFLKYSKFLKKLLWFFYSATFYYSQMAIWKVFQSVSNKHICQLQIDQGDM